MTESTVNYVIFSSRVKPNLLFSGIAVWSNFKNFETRKSVKNILRLIVFCLFVFMNDDENDAASLITDVIISKLTQPSRGTVLYCVRNLFPISKRKPVASHC